MPTPQAPSPSLDKEKRDMFAPRPAFAAATALFLALIAALGASPARSTQAWQDQPEWVGPPSPLAQYGPPLPTIPMRFGLDGPSIAKAQAAGLAPDYGTVWIGHWTEHWGWKDADIAFAQLRDAGVAPAVQLYYWGDDIHSRCFTEGCNGKTMQGWSALATALGQHLQATFGDGHALVILETEFNKDQVKNDETLDAALAMRAQEIRQGAPNATVVLGLGNWYPQAWGTWDQAAAASDAIGLQALAGSTRDGDDRVRGLAALTLDGVQTARAMWSKPIVVHDVAVSSYPEATHATVQQEALQGFADAVPALHDAGVEAILYRSFVDVPTVPLDEHYGEAERHWGLAYSDGTLKPAGLAWAAAMQAASSDAVTDLVDAGLSAG